MPNIGTVLRDEITRLSRKESRRQVNATRKASAQHRKDISALKRQVMELERQVRALSRQATKRSSEVSTDMPATKLRFAPKGLRSQRDRLGLSAEKFGELMGVSAQSIYNWENDKARPRPGQIARLAQLRKLGKRQVQAHFRNAR